MFAPSFGRARQSPPRAWRGLGMTSAPEPLRLRRRILRIRRIRFFISVLLSAPGAVAAQAADLSDTADTILHFSLLSVPAAVAGQAADLADAFLHGRFPFFLDRPLCR